MNKEVIGVFGCGYLGSKLIKKWLDNGNKVIVVDNLYFGHGPLISELLLHPNCEFHYKDAEEIGVDVISRADVWYLTAAYVGMPLCDRLGEEEVRRVNIDLIDKIVSELSKDQRVIGLCSTSGYGTTDAICDELEPMQSISMYGLSKEEGERRLMKHPNATSLRLSTVWGASPYRNRLDLLINEFTYLLTNTNKLELFQGNYQRSYVHIDDVINVLYHIAFDTNSFAEIYNFAQDADNCSKEEIVRRIAGHFDNPSITYLEFEDKDKRNFRISSQKIKNIGYEAIRTIEKDIPELIKFYKLFPKYGTELHNKFVSLMKNA